MKRTDELGRAFAGSQLQMQVYVNRRSSELSIAIETAIWKNLLPTREILWVSPLEDKKFAEYRDSRFLEALQLQQHCTALASFWPSGGPRWDALGTVQNHSSRQQHAILLVEAKSYPREVYGNGCDATPASLQRIEKSLAQAKQWFNVPLTTDWIGPLYQSANRLAHLYFFREVVSVEAWLINLCVLNDPHSPTNAAEWERGLDRIKHELGFKQRNIPYTVDVFLPARSRGELVST